MPSEFARIIDLRVAHRIRERRLRIGMTQQKLAQIIGVVFQQAHKYEHGLSRVSAGQLYHIATALEAPITYFFGAEEHTAPRTRRPDADAGLKRRGLRDDE
jgi:transcriptional regulator with XRE-family HTH domain